MPDPSARDYEWDMACKVYEYLDIKNCLCKIRLFVKLVLACEDETLKAMDVQMSQMDVCMNYKCQSML